MKYQLMIRWKKEDVSLEHLVEMEKILDYEIGIGHEVSGHSVEDNHSEIRLDTDDPEGLLRQVIEILTQAEIESAQVSYRPVNETKVTVLWPIEKRTAGIE